MIVEDRLKDLKRVILNLNLTKTRQNFLKSESYTEMDFLLFPEKRAAKDAISKIRFLKSKNFWIIQERRN